MTTIAERKTLFPGGERSDGSPKRPDESPFGFLCRTANPRFAQGRHFFEAIFARYPEEHQSHLRGRFRSTKAEQHQGAMLELLLFAALGCHGVEVSEETPDFRVKSGNERWSLEATSLTPEAHDMPQEVRTIVGTIERELQSSDYYLSLRLSGSVRSTPSKRQYLRPLQRLLDTPWDVSQSRRISIQINGLQLTATLIRKGSSRGISHSIIGSQSYSDAEISPKPETTRSVRKVLATKARKVGHHGHSERVWLALAIPDHELATGFDELILRALYGVDEFGSVVHTGQSFWFRRNRGSVRTRVEGVIVLGPLLWWALQSREMFCRVYLSPWSEARPPMPIRRLPAVKYDPAGRVIRYDGERLGALVADSIGHRYLVERAKG